MGDNEQRDCTGEYAAQGPVEVFRVKRRKALVQNDEVSTLQQRPGNVEAAAFTVRELPSCLSDRLQQPGRHAVEQVPETELAAEGFGLLNIFGLGWPAATQQQVEGECAGQNVEDLAALACDR